MTNELTIEIGERIRRYREAEGWTQEQFAELAGLTPHHVSALECGKNWMSIKTLMRISQTLNVSTDVLLFGPGRHKELSAMFELPMLMGLDQKQRERLGTAMVEAFARELSELESSETK